MFLVNSKRDLPPLTTTTTTRTIKFQVGFWLRYLAPHLSGGPIEFLFQGLGARRISTVFGAGDCEVPCGLYGAAAAA